MTLWRGKSTDGIMKWNFKASSFADLFNLFMSKENLST